MRYKQRMPTPLSQTVKLLDGAEIPRVGLGVYQSARGHETQHAVSEALRLGYRHIDTARIYGNEQDVGEAVKASGIPRSQIYVTTKLWNDDHGYDAALRACDASLKRLGLETIDLYLLHWPVPRKRLDSWRALEKLQADGKVRSIGVSNFMVHHLEELLGKAKVVPAINQIEVSPFLQQRDVRAFCDKHQIIVEAYSPLTQGEKLDHRAIAAVAKRVSRTPAQVMLRWGLQHGMVTLPKSVRTERIAENFALFDFELDAKSMSELDALEEGLTMGWDPREAP